MSDVFIVSARRTPFGSFGGALSTVPAPQLAAQVAEFILNETKLPAHAIDEVIIGQVLQGGIGQAPARQAMRMAGIPDSTHAMTINKVCGSGLKSIMLAADSIRLGDTQIAWAGGMENMSLAPYTLPTARFGQRMGHGKMLDLLLFDGLLDPYSGRHMGEIAEDWIKRHQLTRTDQDEYAARSYRLCQEALSNNIFAEAYGQDAEFFEFYRSLTAYETSLDGSNTTLVISPDSEFFDDLGSSTGRPAAAAQ